MINLCVTRSRVRRGNESEKRTLQGLAELTRGDHNGFLNRNPSIVGVEVFLGAGGMNKDDRLFAMNARLGEGICTLGRRYGV